jgi:branched-chain amino acid transport system substrate-binding protein
VDKCVVRLLTILLISGLIISGCAISTPVPESTKSQTPAPAPVPITKPIKIGQMYALTGPQAMISEFMMTGSKFALEEAGYEVAGRKIEVITEDTALQPQVALDKARKLIESDKVDLILGPLETSGLMAIEPYISKMGVPHLVSSPNELKLGQYDWHFMLGGSNLEMVHPMALYASEKLGFKTLTAITEDSVNGRMYIDTFSNIFKSKGGTIIQNQYTPIGCPDYASYLANLQDASACLAWFQGADSIRFLTQYHEFGIRKRMPLQSAFYGGFVQMFLVNRLPPAAADGLIGEHAVSIYPYMVDTPEAKKLMRHGNRKTVLSQKIYMLQAT